MGSRAFFIGSHSFVLASLVLFGTACSNNSSDRSSPYASHGISDQLYDDLEKLVMPSSGFLRSAEDDSATGSPSASASYYLQEAAKFLETPTVRADPNIPDKAVDYSSAPDHWKCLWDRSFGSTTPCASEKAVAAALEDNHIRGVDVLLEAGVELNTKQTNDLQQHVEVLCKTTKDYYESYLCRSTAAELGATPQQTSADSNQATLNVEGASNNPLYSLPEALNLLAKAQDFKNAGGDPSANAQLQQWLREAASQPAPEDEILLLTDLKIGSLVVEEDSFFSSWAPQVRDRFDTGTGLYRSRFVDSPDTMSTYSAVRMLGHHFVNIANNATIHTAEGCINDDEAEPAERISCLAIKSTIEPLTTDEVTLWQSNLLDWMQQAANMSDWNTYRFLGEAGRSAGLDLPEKMPDFESSDDFSALEYHTAAWYLDLPSQNVKKQAMQGLQNYRELRPQWQKGAPLNHLINLYEFTIATDPTANITELTQEYSQIVSEHLGCEAFPGLYRVALDENTCSVTLTHAIVRNGLYR